mmetsp:Transcript_17033/g.24723  ORF Transcript_17033/g.24723 Transcript_17033/m.24723 type:complete len:258 (+) Transcript_17033:41-814(+)
MSPNAKDVYEIINHCDTEAPQVASWGEDGRHFVVKDITSFETTFIPKFYNPIKYTSFVKQMNNYGFVNVSRLSTSERDSRREYWRHDFFVKGEIEMVKKIQIQKKKFSRQRETVESLKGKNVRLQSELQEAKKLLQDINDRFRIIEADNRRLKQQNQLLHNQIAYPNGQKYPMVNKEEVAYPHGQLHPIAYPNGQFYPMVKKDEVEPDKKEDFGKSKRKEIEDENSSGAITLLSLRGVMTGGKDDEQRTTARFVSSP